MEVYLALEENLPVRVKYSVEGEDDDRRAGKLEFRMDVWDFNSPSIKIELPR